MEPLINIFTYTHIAAGMLSLVAAPVALAVTKGAQAHRRWGKVFFFSMTWIFVSATCLSLYKGNLFLLLIGVFSYYNVVSGYRALYHKNWHRGGKVALVDWMALVVAAGFNIYFIVTGIRLADTGQAIAYLCLLFGGIGLMNVWQNLRKFVWGPADKNGWLFQHISSFVAGFIASVTAFSTQVLVFLPDFLMWAWPTLVGTPVIVYWIHYYKNQLKNGVRLSELVELRR
ncbi:MAG: hypothetical protein ACOYXA_13825 [Bacteroidota bacterium]